MNEDLRRLVRLQDLIVGTEEVVEKIRGIPAEVARLEKDLLAAQERLETERATLDELQKDRRKLEMDLQDVEARINKYQSQLLEIKTNKEYQAVLKEIESCREQRATLDEKILLEMEEADSRQNEFRKLEGALKENRRNTDEGKKRLDEQLASLEREKASLEADRERLTKEIPANYLDPFTRVARLRKGLALVAVRDELCGGCHVRVLPKLIQEVRRATGLIACDSCKRFMYVFEDAAAQATQAEEPHPR